jgi:DNA-directed RNA polymerase subunit RPC12/RpoP
MANPYYKCLRCGSDNLKEEAELCTGSTPSDDDYVRWIRCAGCDARYIGDVRKEVNVNWDDDHITNSAHACEPAEWDRTLALAKRCRRPQDAKCTCAAHTTRPVIGESAWYRSW